MSHAPGPWKLDGLFDAEVGIDLRASDDTLVFELDPCGPDGWDEPSIANARLIAAAPDLLRIAKGSSHLCKSLLAVREGASDELIQELADFTDGIIAEIESEREREIPQTIETVEESASNTFTTYCERKV